VINNEKFRRNEMKIGLIGLSGVGKTTIFNLLTNTKATTGAYGAKDINIGMSKVPDKRMDYLIKLFKPKKKTVMLRLNLLISPVWFRKVVPENF